LIDIREGGLELPAVQALLRAHLDQMHANSPRESVHALDLTGLSGSDVRFWTAWRRDELMGCGALRTLDPWHGEIKSMRTLPEHLRSGVGAAIVGHILAAARAAGMARLSLETGSGDAFEPAHALYRRFGFTPCDAFGDYRKDDPFSRFMSRAL
jgi:putative acetyltransferase